MSVYDLNTSNELAFNSSVGKALKDMANSDKYSMLVEQINKTAKENNFKLALKNDQAINGKKLINTKRAFDALVAKKYYDKYRNAESRGIHFDLSFTDVKKLLKETHCYFTGVEFSKEKGNELAMTFERVNENEGYTKENTKAVTYAANNWKAMVIDNGGSLSNNLTVEQIKKLLEKL